MLQALWFDFRHTLRSLLNNPFFTLTSVLMLSVGLGLVLFMFGAIQSLVRQPPPYKDAERIVHIELANKASGQKNIQVNLSTYLFFDNNQSKLNDLSGFYSGTVNLNQGLSDAQRVEGTFVTDGLAAALGVRPYKGRFIQAQDLLPGSANVVVLGYRIWQQQFGGDEAIEKKSVHINGQPAQIIGVMPEGFRFPYLSDVWVPMSIPNSESEQVSANSVKVIGRIKNDESLLVIKQHFDQLFYEFKKLHPRFQNEESVDVKQLGDELVLDVYEHALNLMLAAVGLVLLVACANVAGLLGARAATKRREKVIRTVLGASRARLFWAGILESLLITLIATVLGLAIAYLCGSWFMNNLASTENPPPSWALQFKIDGFLIVVSVFVMAISTFVAGFVPSWRGSDVPEGQIISQGGHGSINTGMGLAGHFLITLEIAISLVLLVSASLITRSFFNIDDLSIGADIHNVHTGRVALIHQDYKGEPEKIQTFLRDVQQNMQNSTIVRMSTVTSLLPMTNISTSAVAKDGQVREEEGQLTVSVPLSVADNYFSFFRIPITTGRSFTSLDTQDSEAVVIVSDSLASKLWPNLNAIGQTLWVKNKAGQFENRSVVGVVGDVQYDGRRLGLGSSRGITGAYYLPITQSEREFWSLAMLGQDDDIRQVTLAKVMQGAVSDQDVNMPVYWSRSMQVWVKIASARHKLLAILFGAFGLVALALTGAGLYSLLAFAVTRRTREIGVHRALGAPSHKIIFSVVRHSLKQVLIGAVLGLILSLLFAQLLSFVLIDISPFDPVSFLLAVLFFMLICLFASLVPAVRAVRITPMQALRYE